MVVVIQIDVANVVDHHFIGQMFEWLISGQCQDLPQSDGKRPNVRFGSEVSLNLNEKKSCYPNKVTTF